MGHIPVTQLPFLKNSRYLRMVYITMLPLCFSEKTSFTITTASSGLPVSVVKINETIDRVMYERCDQGDFYTS